MLNWTWDRSGNLIQTLLRHDLVYEFRLWVFPLVIGSGKRLFSDGTVPSGLELVDSTLSSSGVVMGDVRASRRDPVGSACVDNLYRLGSRPQLSTDRFDQVQQHRHARRNVPRGR